MREPRIVTRLRNSNSMVTFSYNKTNHTRANHVVVHSAQATDHAGYTALHHAVLGGDLTCVTYLLSES